MNYRKLALERLRLDSSTLLRAPIKLPILRILKRRHLEIIRQLKFRIRVALERLEVHQQRVLDREHGVVFNVLAAAVEDLGDDWLVACGPELRMAISL